MSTTPLDRAGPWRFQELPERSDLPEPYRYEVVDGHLLVIPPPSQRHQLAAAALVQQLARAAPAEWLVAQELALPLGTDGRVPDIAVVRAAAPTASGPYPRGPEMFGLVGEVMSPDSRKTDLFAKPGEYSEAGIPLLWRLDLEPSPRLHAFRLDAGAYDLVTVLESRGEVPVPWGVMVVDLSRLPDR
jgi:Uma2 family endonuclease